MRAFLQLLFLSYSLFSLCTDSVAVDTIAADQAVRDNDILVSADEMYELGFFSPGNSKNRYLGIWFKKISPQTVVWVANRETPVSSSSGVFRVNSKGTLQILSGNNTMIWSSDSSLSVSNINIVAKLLDSGNLVVFDNSTSSADRNLIWQSFDYPCDTQIAGMKFGKDLVTGKEWNLTSWKSLDDPSPGLYVSWWDTNGYPQVFQKRGEVIQLRFGPWNGVRFSGFPSKENSIYRYIVVFNEKEVYSGFELINTSFVSRVYLGPEGHWMRLNWIDPTQGWLPFLASTVDVCAQYGLCGPYGSCNLDSSPECSCIKGFEPRFPKEWNASDWSGGCQRRMPLNCDEDGFRKITGVKLPDTRHSWYNWSMNLGECERACKSNCSCTAYANLDIRNGGSGCLLWFDGLMDITENNEVEYLYIRMAASELTIKESGPNKKELIEAVLAASGGLVLICAALAVCAWRKKRSHAQRQGNLVKYLCEDYTDGGHNKDTELPFFSFSEISKMTNNFSINNKLGEGGFGPVYKGVMVDGREIAVKRLSETSSQGFDEFKNEVRCIHRLQHRNLVKLLGCCIRSEIMLIYEYMPNGSLDMVIFDATRNSCLSWSQRFHIINGIARGLLYLHQDSRLRIIHRDLKASNILLDNEMNPKISDFGLAKRFKGYETGDRTRNVVGTYGYMPPEYAIRGHYSVKSDVFSFGVLVLEIVSGKKNREFSSHGHSDNLLGHAWRLYKDGKSLELVGGPLANSPEVLRSIHVGLLCVQNNAEDRPTMSDVVLMLGNEGVLAEPKKPAFFTVPDDAPMPQSISVNDLTISLAGR